jgi:hypothetical protein
MTITRIALDDLLQAFADALAGANRKIAERHQAYQSGLREKYGAAVSTLVSQRAAPRVKRGTITIMALPFIKRENGEEGKENRVYLKLAGLNKRELSFEITLEN